MSSRHILMRWLIASIAVLVTAFLLPGITIEGNGFFVAIVVAAILGLINAVVRPILVFLSCGCIVATLGLFMFVINTFTLWLASQISQWLGFGFYVDGFLPALIGSIVISVVSWLLSMFLIGDDERGK